MEISKLNPIGYQTTTQKGNSYKRTNLGKSVAIGTIVATNVAAEVWKSNKFINIFSISPVLKDLATTLKVPNISKFKIPLAIAGTAIDVLFALQLGKYIDNKINSKREAKADKNAEITNA